MKRFSLVGVDGNVFAIIGYTAKCLKRAGLRDKVEEMRMKAMSGDYWNAISVCDEYVEMANEALGLEDEEYDD